MAKRRFRVRDAVTGLFVKATEAIRRPATTTREAVAATPPLPSAHPVPGRRLAGLEQQLGSATSQLHAQFITAAAREELRYGEEFCIATTLDSGDMLFVTITVGRGERP